MSNVLKFPAGKIKMGSFDYTLTNGEGRIVVRGSQSVYDALEASTFLDACFMFKDAIRRGVIIDDNVILNLFKGE
jgi:hypothetical protein